MFELTGKCHRLHSPSRTRALYQGLQRCSVYAQHQREPQHAFVADEADFETGMAVVDRSDQRDEAIRGKEDVTNALAGLAQYIGEPKLNLFAAREQMLTILAG